MWVAPQARGRGVGAALIDAVVAWARSKGFVGLLLDVGDDNASAISLYARKGFEPNGDADGDGGLDFIVWNIVFPRFDFDYSLLVHP